MKMIERIRGIGIALSMIMFLGFVFYTFSGKEFASETIASFFITFVLLVTILTTTFLYRLLFPPKPYTLDKFRIELTQYNLLKENQIVGCTAQEIEEVMKSQKVKALPETYVKFLSKFGKTLLKHPYDEGLFYPSNLNNLTIIFDNVEKPTTITPQDIFIISHNGSSQINYFLLGESDNNPPIWVSEVSNSGLDEGFVITNSFTDYLKSWVRDIKAEQIYRK